MKNYMVSFSKEYRSDYSVDMIKSSLIEYNGYEALPYTFVVQDEPGYIVIMTEDKLMASFASRMAVDMWADDPDIEVSNK